jgi:hypothetical protein
MKSIFTLTGILLIFSFGGQGQQPGEKDLLEQFQKISFWSDYKGNDQKVNSSDSLEIVNRLFKVSLLAYTSRSASTISSTFNDLLKEGLTIATSPDGKFRIYSWDTWTGGSMHFFENVYQFKSGDHVFSKAILDKSNEADPGYWFSEIFSLKNIDTTYYLAIRHGIYSGSDSYQGIKVFSIDSDSLLSDVKFIKTKTGIKNTLGFNFDFFSVVDRPERPVKLINYDTVSKTISIPAVQEKGKVTSKTITYQFTGKYFELKK